MRGTTNFARPVEFAHFKKLLQRGRKSHSVNIWWNLCGAVLAAWPAHGRAASRHYFNLAGNGRKSLFVHGFIDSSICQCIDILISKSHQRWVPSEHQYFTFCGVCVAWSCGECQMNALRWMMMTHTKRIMGSVHNYNNGRRYAVTNATDTMNQWIRWMPIDSVYSAGRISRYMWCSEAPCKGGANDGGK